KKAMRGARTGRRPRAEYESPQTRASPGAQGCAGWCFAPLSWRSCRLPYRNGLRSARMQAAFLALGILPPPAPGPDVLPDGHRAGTGRATDARIKAVVQRI